LSTDLLLAIELVAIVFGVFFMFVASMGVFRLKDFYMRVHAPTKAATLGLVFLLVAVAIGNAGEFAVVTKALLAVLFIAATAPVGAHLLSRAAYRFGVPRSPETKLDEYAPVAQARRRGPIPEPARARDLDSDEDAAVHP
jgi:multicomponent Na+:H+ antiporter subunit G